MPCHSGAVTQFRIAIAQPAITGDVHENGRTVRRLMRDAAASEVRLVQFPEGMVSGYAKEQVKDWSEVDWPAVRVEVEAVAALAAELGMWVVVGSAHLLSEPNRPHNSMYVISDEGSIVDRYDKRFCSNTEITRFYSPGFAPTTFDVDGLRFGCILCVEINFPELFAEYEKLGVDCLLVSAYPVDSMFETKARAHASINNYWIGLSVPAQTAHLMASELINPNGAPIAQATGGA
jgi:predicted amidohydrolase